MLLNDEAADSFGRPGFNFYYMIKKFFVVRVLKFYFLNLFFQKYDNAETLSKSMGIDYSVLSKTLTAYNDFVVGKADKKKVFLIFFQRYFYFCSKFQDQFDKSTFPIAFPLDKPLYVALVTPAIHYTMGGLKIDKNVGDLRSFQEISGLLTNLFSRLKFSTSSWQSRSRVCSLREKLPVNFLNPFSKLF